jgi:hypothetical protein
MVRQSANGSLLLCSKKKALHRKSNAGLSPVTWFIVVLTDNAS